MDQPSGPRRWRFAKRTGTEGARGLIHYFLTCSACLDLVSPLLMQIRQSQLLGDRPLCHIDPTHSIHIHGSYNRYADCDNTKKTDIDRFLCYPCQRTISVLPDVMLPYRSVSASLVEKNFDARANDKPEPAATINEMGCLKRAWKRFGQRLGAHASALGQIMQIRSQAAKPFWRQLRRLGNLSSILLLMSRSFNTSLLGDYCCLRPWCSG